MSPQRGRARLGWELIRVLQETLMGLEATASRILAAEVAGTIAAWSQLYTFENGPPEVMAWVSLVVFIVATCFLGVFLRPRRIVRFWDHALPDELFAAKRPVTPEEEAATIEHIAAAMRKQRDTLEFGIRVSIPLGIAAVTVLFSAYALEKAFYPP